MTRALIAVGALLALAFAGFGLVVYLNREEDMFAVDNVLALELTRSIGVADQDGGDVDLTRLAPGDWDRVLVATPGVSRDEVSEALGATHAAVDRQLALARPPGEETPGQTSEEPA